MEHEHNFSETLQFGFEDVLVTEFTECTIPGCETTKPVQYEVDFTTFVYDGDQASIQQAEELWDAIIKKYGSRPEITNERWHSGSVEYSYTNDRRVSYYYDDDFEQLQSIQLFIDGKPVRFDVTHYRDLDYSNKS